MLYKPKSMKKIVSLFLLVFGSCFMPLKAQEASNRKNPNRELNNVEFLFAKKK
jgi:hypothetical protein